MLNKIVSKYLTSTRTKKSAFADLVNLTNLLSGQADNLTRALTQIIKHVIPPSVIPAKAGIQVYLHIDSRLRGNDNTDSGLPREYLPANATHQALQAGARNDKSEVQNDNAGKMKKTDGRLRECLSTLVIIQPRSKNEYYHHQTKKSRKSKYKQNAK